MKQINSPEFVASLFDVTRSFASAGQSASIDELFEAYEREILAAPNLVQPLLHHYGQEIVQRELEPKDDFAYRAFETLERVATSSRVPELALAYRTLYESKKSPSEVLKTVVKLIERSVYLNDMDRTRYLQVMLLRSNAGNWTRTSTPEAHAIEGVVRSLFATYSAVLRNAYGLEESTARKIATNGLNYDEAEVLATQLATRVPTENTRDSPHDSIQPTD